MKIPLSLFAAVLLAGAPASTEAQAPAANPTLIESNKVAAAFVKGMPLLENSQFKIQAGRRDAPGIAEIHTRDTDIFHVLEGSATFVTGGVAVEPKTIAPDEIRAKEIKGGVSRKVHQGDIIVVPNGVPHWFSQVDGPFRYFVVKVTGPAPGSHSSPSK